jgi:hypothetical protein
MKYKSLTRKVITARFSMYGLRFWFDSSAEVRFSYNLGQMKKAVDANSVKIPHGLKGKVLRDFILESSIGH